MSKFFIFTPILQGNALFSGKITQQETILHDRRSRRSRLISSLAAAALIIFLPKRCQLIWSNFRSMMTSSKAQQCAKLPAWMFGGPYFASGRGKRQTFWAGAGGQYLRGRLVKC